LEILDVLAGSEKLSASCFLTGNLKRMGLADLPSLERQDRSIAVVTKTYLPDLGQCEVLAESLDRLAPHVPHYLIVDRRDRPAFSHLERGKRRLIDSEALVGKWMWRMPGSKGFWLSLKAPPVRGWIIQQILKIGAVEAVSERTLIFCDSDMAFLRRFDRDDLLVEGKVGLLDVDYVNEDYRQWTAAACRLLGLSEHDVNYRGYVGHMICWNRETVKAMQQRIEKSTGCNWQVALARIPSFSEYMLYGIFVREVLGYDAVDHAPSTMPLVKASYGVAMTTDLAIETFLTDLDPRTVAMMVHSKDSNDPALLRKHLEPRWNEMDRVPECR
jgi:hypothetical protein